MKDASSVIPFVDFQADSRLRFGFGRTALLALLCGICGQQTWATDRSGVLAGSVLDATGAAISSCPVTAESSTGRDVSQLLTSSQGRFTLQVPRSGTRITVTCVGFLQESRVFFWKEGTHQEVIFRLRVAGVSESVTVNGSGGALELAQGANQEAETLDASTIAVLPVLDQDYVSFMSRFLDPSATGTQGATLVVNGVEGGNFYQAPSAIKQLQVNQDQYSPAYATAGRGRLSLITSSGTKQVHGSFSFALREHAWDATPDFSPIKPPENREDYQGSVTGPVRGTRNLQFALSAQLKKDEQFGVINAITPAGVVQEPFATPYYRNKVSGALFFDDGAGRQFTAGLGRTDEVHHNGSVGGLELPSTGGFSEYTGHFLDLQATNLISAHTLNQARLALGQESLNIADATSGPQTDVAGAFVSGSGQATHSYRQDILSGNEVLATSRKSDTVRFGLDVPELSIHTDTDQTDRAGIYSYPSLSAYQAGQPDLFTITQGTGTVRFISFSTALFVEDSHRFSNHISLMSGLRYYFQNVYHNRSTHLAPRTELAISLGKQSHTVIRTGGGIFYDRLLTTNLAYLLQFNGQRLNRYIEENPAASVTSTQELPPSFVTVSPRATLPYLVQWSAALEQQLTPFLTASIQGTMNAGVHQLRMLDTNAPLLPDFRVRPNMSFGQVLSSNSEGHAHSDAVDIMLKLSPTHGVTQQLRYRLSRSLNDTDGFSYVPANSLAPEQDASYASFDQRHNLSLLSGWPLPWKFTFGTVLQAGSGLPYTELLGEDENRDGTPNDRPAGVGRNSLRGTAQYTLDGRLGRDLRIGSRPEKPMLSLSLSGFNLTNHPNFVSYEGVITSPAFGRPITAGAPRQLQLNAILSF